MIIISLMHMSNTPAPSIMAVIKSNLPSLVLLLAGLLGGLLWFTAARFFAYHATETHYHSNFALYVDGEREEFKSFTYYEEVSACTTAFADNPKGRVHMHSGINDVIHVHDKAVTYADFFENIDWTLGPSFMRTANGLLVNNDEKLWVFILNGERVARVDNLVIGDEDKLLLSYGVADTNFKDQYNKIENKAEETDNTTDPASCSGLNGPHDNSFFARLKRAVDITQ